MQVQAEIGREASQRPSCRGEHFGDVGIACEDFGEPLFRYHGNLQVWPRLFKQMDGGRAEDRIAQ